jgi:hypothetical protein
LLSQFYKSKGHIEIIIGGIALRFTQGGSIGSKLQIKAEIAVAIFNSKAHKKTKASFYFLLAFVLYPAFICL